MLAPEERGLSRWFYTAELVGRQVTTGKAKEKLPLTPTYLRVLVLGNLQLPEIRNKSLNGQCIWQERNRSTWHYEYIHIYIIYSPS